MRKASIVALAAVLATGMWACAGEGNGTEMAQAQGMSDAVPSALTSQFESVSGYLLSAAEQVSEDDYSFAPTEEVRNLGGILGHVAGAHYAYCSAARGEEAPAAAQQEATTKAEIVEKLRASRDYCLQGFRQTSADQLGQSANVFGSESDVISAMLGVLVHDNLHYGNIVTYMRSIDMVPPSSQGS